MKNNNNIMKNFLQYPNAVKFIALATFITNIGSGMHLIAVSKLAYDETNSAMAFGGVIIMQYFIMFLVQFLSGTIADSKNPKKIIVFCDVTRGVLILSSGVVFLIFNNGLQFLLIALLIVNIITPFYSTAHFTLLPEIINDKETLLKTNSFITTLFQAGQLIGSASAAPILFFLNPAAALIIDGLTFLISAFIFSFVKIDNVRKKNIKKENVGKTFFVST